MLVDWVPGHFPARRLGAGSVRRDRALRARRPAPGRAARLGHLRLQLRQERGPQLPGGQRPLLDRAVPRRRAAGGRGGLDALPRLLPARRRLGAQPLGRPGEFEDAIDFLRELNTSVRTRHPGVHVIAEESTAWPRVTGAVAEGGLGFTLKWNMGWMHDTLKYFATDPLFRAGHHHKLTFGLLYAYSEHFVLPLSHDEVVHLKGSLYGRMPGGSGAEAAEPPLAPGLDVGPSGPEAALHGGRVRSARGVEPRPEPRLAPALRAGPCRRPGPGQGRQPPLRRRAGAAFRRRLRRRLPLDPGRLGVGERLCLRPLGPRGSRGGLHRQPRRPGLDRLPGRASRCPGTWTRVLDTDAVPSAGVGGPRRRSPPPRRCPGTASPSRCFSTCRPSASSGWRRRNPCSNPVPDMFGLNEALVFLAAVVISVPLFKALRLGSVLGYLVVGVAHRAPRAEAHRRRPSGPGEVAEFGVVLLLFLVGLELQPQRLWELRHRVFGVGTVQVVSTGLLLGLAALALGLSWQAALVTGFGLSLSSTAFVLQLLGERNQLPTPVGQTAFGILLFQDLAVIPAPGGAPAPRPRQHADGHLLGAPGQGGGDGAAHRPRRPLPAPPRLPPGGLGPEPGGVHRLGAAPRGGHGGAGLLRRAEHGPGRLPGRRAPRRLRVPPRAGGGHRALPGPADGALLHVGGDVGRPGAAGATPPPHRRAGPGDDRPEAPGHRRPGAPDPRSVGGGRSPRRPPQPGGRVRLRALRAGGGRRHLLHRAARHPDPGGEPLHGPHPGAGDALRPLRRPPPAPPRQPSV